MSKILLCLKKLSEKLRRRRSLSFCLATLVLSYQAQKVKCKIVKKDIQVTTSENDVQQKHASKTAIARGQKMRENLFHVQLPIFNILLITILENL